MKLRKNKKGFTLVEIIVVLVIMGILLAIAAPSILGYVNRANDQRFLAEARNGFLGAQTIVARENATQPTTRSTLVADELNAEIGEDLVEAAACTVVTTAASTAERPVYEIGQCSITLEDDNGRAVLFVANQTASVVDTPTANTATTYPAGTPPVEPGGDGQ